MINWQTIKSLLIFFGPFLLPRLLTTYRSLTTARAPGTQPHSPSPLTSRALLILTASALLALATTLPLFHPQNIFHATSSRLQTQSSVLLTRLRALRPLTSQDEALKSFFDAGGLQARLLYGRFGPDVVLGCPVGEVGEPWGWLVCALPGLVGWHVAHLVLLGLATSEALCGRDAAGWRLVGVLGAVALGGVEVWAVMGGYEDGANLRSTRVGEVGFLFWKGLVWRGVGVAAFDALLGWAVWLQGTGRGWVQAKGVGERVGEQVRVLEGVLNSVRGLGVMRNGAGRDREMRAVVERYWTKDEEVMRDVFEEAEVVRAQRKALGMVDMGRMEVEAERSVDAILGGVQVVRR